MRDLFVPTKNTVVADEASERALATRKILLINGRPGRGKTAWAHERAKRRGAVYVRLYSHWSLRMALQGILRDILQVHVGLFSIDRLVARLWEGLCELPGIEHELLVDEADYLLLPQLRRLLFILRDGFDSGYCLPTLISIEGLAHKLDAPESGLYEAVKSRLSERVTFRDCSSADARSLAEKLVEGTVLAPDLVDDLLRIARGSLRSLMTSLAGVEQIAQAAEVKRVDLATYRRLLALTSGSTVAVESDHGAPSLVEVARKAAVA